MDTQHFSGGILREEWCDSSRIVTQWDTLGIQVGQRPYTATENAQADIAAAQAAAQAVAETLAADTLSNEGKIEQAIAKLATLLGAATVPGSIRATIGPDTATAGTTSLRALKAQSNTVVVTAASIKALIGLTIDALQLVIDGDQATRRIARQTLRLARLQTGDYASADVGADV
ncbi:MAG: hypothetical protein WAQ75_02335 [Propionicimonas sp.]